jgi:Ca2+-binding RTX toxin-like protein
VWTDGAVVVTRLNTNGTLDGSYGNAGRTAPYGFADDTSVEVRDLVLQNGKALVLTMTFPDSWVVPGLFRFNTNGTPDNSFGGGDGREYFEPKDGSSDRDDPQSMALDSQNRILVATESIRLVDQFIFDPDFSVFRFTPDGQRDATFGNNGRVFTDFNQQRPFPEDGPSVESSRDVAVMPDGRVVVVGDLGDVGGYGVARYLATATTAPPLQGVEIVNGVLRVTGTEGNDDIKVDDRGPTAGNVIVTRNGASGTFTRSQFTRIEIRGLGGNDKLHGFVFSQTGDNNQPNLPMLVHGGAGDDELVGGNGNDTLLGLEGNDTLFGLPGDDLLDGGQGADLMTGGTGADTVDYHFRNSAVFVDFAGGNNDGPAGEGDTVSADNEHIIGGNGNDTLIGNDNPNFIRGGPGNDTIRGGGGNDTLVGDGGQDRLFGEGGNDFLDARDGITDLVLDGGADTDTAKKDNSDPTTSIELLA